MFYSKGLTVPRLARKYFEASKANPSFANDQHTPILDNCFLLRYLYAYISRFFGGVQLLCPFVKGYVVLSPGSLCYRLVEMKICRLR